MRTQYDELEWGAIHLVLRAGSNTWAVARPFKINWRNRDGEKRTFTVMRGATTDFASVPWMFQWLVSMIGRHTRGAIVHDALYREPKHRDGLSRKDADVLLRSLALAAGTPRWRSALLYWGVRLGGKKAWRVDRSRMGL